MRLATNVLALLLILKKPLKYVRETVFGDIYHLFIMICDKFKHYWMQKS